jgi:sulfatase modifying factor 1
MIRFVTPCVRAGKIAITIFAVSLSIGGCRAQSGKADTAKVQALVAATKANMINVEGGEFQMGDFGESHTDDKLPLSSGSDNKPLHKVRLSTFAISKNKITYDEYDTYALANNLPSAIADEKPNASEKKYRQLPGSGSFPAAVPWDQAHSYCKWIGQQLGQSFDLPTEAQWEYAARVRGQLLVYPTDNGRNDAGRNAPTEDDVEKKSGTMYAPIKIGSYPPNALGLFDMGKNGLEWMKDWYAQDYYSHSTEQDPQGPDAGKRKVLRSIGNESKYPAMTIERHAREPEGFSEKDIEMAKDLGVPVQKSVYAFRCVASAAAR